ncbi:hypothetical protein [Xanthomonas oryzae]|nr:hypothetical protein [Xanthomonas oryzae]
MTKKTLQTSKANVEGLGLSLPSTWQFLKMDDALAVESERGILANLIAVDGNITIAALPNPKTSAKDEVITCISIFTAFSPPPTCEVTAGGLMESELRMSFSRSPCAACHGM